MRFKSVHDGERTGSTPLRFAVMGGRCDIAAALLDEGADITAPLKHGFMSNLEGCPFFEIHPGTCCLAQACVHLCPSADGSSFDSSDMVQLLLSRGANIKRIQTGMPKGNMLHLSCVNSRFEVTKLLMQTDPTLWRVPHAGCILPLEEVVMVGTADFVKKCFAEFPEQLVATKINPSGHSWCHKAVNHIGDVEVLRAVLELGADPNADPGGTITSAGKWPELAHPNDVRMNIHFPLRVVVFNIGRLVSRVSKRPPMILDRMAHSMWCCSALHNAAHQGQLACVKLLLESGARIDSTVHLRKMTPLHVAAMCGHEEVVEVHRSPPPARTRQGCSR